MFPVARGAAERGARGGRDGGAERGARAEPARRAAVHGHAPQAGRPPRAGLRRPGAAPQQPQAGTQRGDSCEVTPTRED